MSHVFKPGDLIEVVDLENKTDLRHGSVGLILGLYKKIPGGVGNVYNVLFNEEITFVNEYWLKKLCTSP